MLHPQILTLPRDVFRLLKLILHSELRRRAASRRALPCSSSYYFLTLGTYDPEGDEKLRKWIYKLGYDHQSVRSVDGKLSCSRTSLWRCINTETLWYRKLVSLASPELEVILRPINNNNNNNYYYYYYSLKYDVITIRLHYENRTGCDLVRGTVWLFHELVSYLCESYFDDGCTETSRVQDQRKLPECLSVVRRSPCAGASAAVAAADKAVSGPWVCSPHRRSDRWHNVVK